MGSQDSMGRVVTGWEDYSLVEIMSQIQQKRIHRKADLINFMAELEQRYGPVVESEPVYQAMSAELSVIEAGKGELKLTL